MAFVKLRCDTAYATGAIRTNLDFAILVSKLKRVGLGATVVNGDLQVTCGGDTWIFGEWEPDGLGRIGWIGIKTMGNVSHLSSKLAELGIRHKFEYSRPFDLTTSDVRSVTRYDYRWDTPGLAPRAAVVPDITTFDEQL